MFSVSTNFRPWTKIHEDGVYEVNISCERDYIKEWHKSLMFTGSFILMKCLAKFKGASSFFQEFLKLEGQEFPFTRMNILGVSHLVTIKDNVLTAILVERPYWGEWKFVPNNMQGLKNMSPENWNEYLSGLEGLWLDEVLLPGKSWLTLKGLSKLTSLRKSYQTKEGQFFKGQGFDTVTVGTQVVIYKHPEKEVFVTDSPEYGVAARVFFDLGKAKGYARGTLHSDDVKDDCIRIIHISGWEQELLPTINSL